MKMKPLTKENCVNSFDLLQRLMESILFLILAIQLIEEFFESVLFVPATVILSHVGAFIFLYGILFKFLAIRSEKTVYSDQRDVVSFYDNFLGSILIPMIFLYDADSAIFDTSGITKLELVKQCILVAALVSAVLSRVTLRFSEKHFKQIGSQQTKEQPQKIFTNFEKVLLSNYCSAILNFVLCCAFWILSFDIKWRNPLSGDAVLGITLLTVFCVMMATFMEDKKRIRLAVSIIATLAVTVYYLVKLLQ